MPKILIINPNTTPSMTQKMLISAQGISGVNFKVDGLQPKHGPVSIEGYYDEAISVPPMLECIKNNTDYDAYVIGCFDDTGLDAARCLTEKPVIGIGEAAFHFASFLANQFTVITTLSCSVPALKHNLSKYGLSTKCAKVRSCEVPVLELEQPNSTAHEKIALEIQQAINEDSAEAIVLGCAGMTDLVTQFSQEFKIPVLDGVVCAIKMAESLIALNLQTSKIGGYQAPRQKTIN